MPARKSSPTPEAATNDKHPALIVLEEIEHRLKPVGDMHRHDTAWVKAKIAEAKTKL